MLNMWYANGQTTFYLGYLWYTNDKLTNFNFLGVKGEPGVPMVGPKGSEGFPGEKGEKGNYNN